MSKCLAGFFLVLFVATSSFGAWPAPAAGWQHSYEAGKSGGATPDQADPPWNVRYRTGSTCYTYADEMTGEKTLRLDNTKGGGLEYQACVLDAAAGRGTAKDRMTVEIRFRLVEPIDGHQLFFAVSRPAAKPGESRSYHFRFARKLIAYDTSSGLWTVDRTLGTEWHIARITIDVANDSASLYLDGSTTPVISAMPGRSYKTDHNLIQMGDGSRSVKGKVNVSYVRWTTAEIVPADSGARQAVIGDPAVQQKQLASMRRKRKEAAHRRRRIIMNSDCGDFGLLTIFRPVHFPGLPVTEKMFLALRYSALAGSQVDAIFYNWEPDKGPLNWGNYTYLDLLESVDQRAEILKKENRATWRVIQQAWRIWSRALDLVVDFGHKHSMEIFWTVRMNDTHDTFQPELFPQWKKDHPECLMGKKGQQFPYGGGRWSAVDYAMPVVRQKMFEVIKDVCTSADVDGIELDFFRHPILFGPQMTGESVTQEQCDMMTGLIRRVRDMTEQVALSRGRPLVIAVRIPDSVGYAKAVGLDIVRWLDDDLIDIIVGGGYLHLEPWVNLVALGKGYGVPVYASLSQSRVRYGNLYQEAVVAWKAGVNGVYLFNYFNPNVDYWRVCGSLETLKKYSSQSAYQPVAGKNYASYWLKDGAHFAHVVRIDSKRGQAFPDSTEIRMSFPSSKYEMRYTLDGGEPTRSSSLYRGSFVLNRTAEVRAMAFGPGGKKSWLSRTQLISALTVTSFHGKQEVHAAISISCLVEAAKAAERAVVSSTPLGVRW